MGANVTQSKDLSIAAPTNDQRLAEQRLMHEATARHVGAHGRDVPQPAQKLGLEITHGTSRREFARSVTSASTAGRYLRAYRPLESTCNGPGRDDVSDD